MTRKTIFINGRFLTHAVTGVQRYSLELIRQMDLILAEGHQDVEFVCLVPRAEIKHPGWKNIEIRPIGLNKGNIWEQVDLPLYARGNLLFSPANLGPCYYRNQVVTIHDASVFAVPQAYPWAFRAKYIFVFKQLAHRARLILTDSDFSRQELARYLKVSPERFIIIPLGAEHLNSVRSDTKVLETYHLGKNAYLLTVANQSAHKNFSQVVDALKLLKSDFPVIAVGGSFKQVFQKQKVQPTPANIQFSGYVSDEKLKALYENALGFIFPSIYEGFGLPALEAMQFGCPVICSNAASLPEVAGNAALYFDPHRVDSLADALNSFLSSPQLREELREKGYEHSARFQWSQTAQRTLEILFGALEN